MIKVPGVEAAPGAAAAAQGSSGTFAAMSPAKGAPAPCRVNGSNDFTPPCLPCSPSRPALLGGSPDEHAEVKRAFIRQR